MTQTLKWFPEGALHKKIRKQLGEDTSIDQEIGDETPGENLDELRLLVGKHFSGALSSKPQEPEDADEEEENDCHEEKEDEHVDKEDHLCPQEKELHARVIGRKAPAKRKATKDKVEAAAAAAAQPQGAAAKAMQKRPEKQQPKTKRGRPSKRTVKASGGDEEEDEEDAGAQARAES
ncbi:g3736 [Coccomyxa elongata]